MASTSETGHAKNVANLQKLTEQIKVYNLYNPPVDNLKIVNLQSLYTDSTTKLSEVEDKRNANKNRIPTNLKELRENTENYMDNLIKDTQKVSNFFKHPSISYAA